MELAVLEGTFAVCRLEPDAPVPAPPADRTGPGALWGATRTAEELSIVCAEGDEPDGAEISGGWRAMRVAGTLEHSLTGVLSSLLAPLADEGVPVFALATFDTDYLLVPAASLDAARAALTAAGHDVAPGP